MPPRSNRANGRSTASLPGPDNGDQGDAASVAADEEEEEEAHASATEDASETEADVTEADVTGSGDELNRTPERPLDLGSTLSRVVDSLASINRRLDLVERSKGARRGELPPRVAPPTKLPRSAVEAHVANLCDSGDLDSVADYSGGQLDEIFGIGVLVGADGGILPCPLHANAGISPVVPAVHDDTSTSVRSRAAGQQTGHWARDFLDLTHHRADASRAVAIIAYGLKAAVDSALWLRQEPDDAQVQQAYVDAVTQTWIAAESYLENAARIDIIVIKDRYSVADARFVEELYIEQRPHGLHGAVGKILTDTRAARHTQKIKFEAQSSSRSRGGRNGSGGVSSNGGGSNGGSAGNGSRRNRSGNGAGTNSGAHPVSTTNQHGSSGSRGRVRGSASAPSTSTGGSSTSASRPSGGEQG